ncbi:hypothetical protein GCM10020000_03410 [Streptomyces olivoverticillatus]
MSLPHGPLLVLRELRQPAEPLGDGIRVRGLPQARTRPQQPDPPLRDVGGKVFTGQGVQYIGGRALCHGAMMHQATDRRPVTPGARAAPAPIAPGSTPPSPLLLNSHGTDHALRRPDMVVDDDISG